MSRRNKLILVASALAGLLWWAYERNREFFPWTWPTTLVLTGMVHDGSGAGVDNARVIVTIHNDWLFWHQMFAYATTTDQSGRFAIRQDAPFPIEHMYAEAISVDDKYGSDAVDRYPPSTATIQLHGQEDDKQFHYGNFEGKSSSFIHASNIKFIGEMWEIRTPTEVRWGDELPAAEPK